MGGRATPGPPGRTSPQIENHSQNVRSVGGSIEAPTPPIPARTWAHPPAMGTPTQPFEARTPWVVPPSAAERQAAIPAWTQAISPSGHPTPPPAAHRPRLRPRHSARSSETPVNGPRSRAEGVSAPTTLPTPVASLRRRSRGLTEQTCLWRPSGWLPSGGR